MNRKQFCPSTSIRSRINHPRWCRATAIDYERGIRLTSQLNSLSPSPTASFVAEDEGFEPSKGCPLHAFQACALGRYANPPRSRTLGLGRRVSVLETMITHRSSVRRYRAELPQDRKVARVGALWRVCGGSLIKENGVTRSI